MALEQTNDAKYLANGSFPGAIDDRFKRVMEAAVTRAGSERSYWLSVFPTGVGTLNDIKRQYFQSLGYVGSIQDMENIYWSTLSP